MPIICRFDKCNTQATFNHDGQRTASHCSKHKLEGMVNVKDIICHHDGCKKQANFNTSDKNKPLFCGTHKKIGMVNVKCRNCDHDGCTIRPAYNYPGEKRRLFCVSHKLDGMINVISRGCYYDGCNTQPGFNYIQEKKPLFCVSHKLDGMVNVLYRVCHHDGCTILPVFNTPGKNAPLFCKTHKLDGMVNVKQNSCVLDGCYTLANKSKYNGYCLRCAIYMAPDTVNKKKNYKTKEKHVVDELIPLLDNHELDVTFDKRIMGDLHIFETGEGICCNSLRRPDILIDRHTHCIIVEIDENQHRGYNCENARVMEMFQALGMRPLVLIRFNPDSYVNANKVDVKSCFDYNNQLQVPKITIDTRNEWNKRIQVLIHVLKGYIQSNDVPKKEITSECLFYDGFA